MAEYGLVCARLREEGLDLVAELIEKLQAERDALKVERDKLLRERDYLLHYVGED